MPRRVDQFRRANQAAVALRDRLRLDDLDPVNAWDVANALGIPVRFVDTNMEGMYFAGAPPRIVQTSLRPMGRRMFTCAHEIGHHEFEHGTRLDTAIAELAGGRDANEQLVDAFAASFLMPSIGIRRAFAERGWDITTPTPIQVFTVACEYGVGYETLLLYLETVMRVLPASTRMALAKVTPKAIRADTLGETEAKTLVLLDSASRCRTVEIEVGSVLALPHGATVAGGALEEIGSFGSTRQFRATARGTALITGALNAEARVWPKAYVGLAKFRALEE